MRKVFLLVIVLLVTSISAQAQSDTKGEVWGTYSLFSADSDFLDFETMHGFGFGGQYNLSPRFGIVGEFTSNRKSTEQVTIFVPGRVILFPELETKVNAFLFGPRVSYRGDVVTVFGHFLLGGATASLKDELSGSGFEDSNTEFAMAIGGGVDVNLGRHFAIRVAQFDYLPIHTDIGQRLGGIVSDSSWLHNGRYQAGFVFKF
jgi:opacity protein-like surface antigen